MSIISCNSCLKQVDTDYTDPLCVLDKYWYCESCMDKSEIYEVLDEMQVEIDRIERENTAFSRELKTYTYLNNNLTKSLAETVIELRTVYDSAKQGLEHLGLSLD